MPVANENTLNGFLYC